MGSVRSAECQVQAGLATRGRCRRLRPVRAPATPLRPGHGVLAEVLPAVAAGVSDHGSRASWVTAAGSGGFLLLCACVFAGVNMLEGRLFSGVFGYVCSAWVS